ncbi:MAG TPA: hypothetical protein VNS55_12005 [Nocardioides sp.]|nr:hypothetical protein [Nocardioides sp.]
MATTPTSLVTDTAAGALGGVLAGASRVLTHLRRGPKPLHPEGEVVSGTLRRTGSAGCGVPWLESTGTDDVVVRLSRAVGLPDALPDIYGLAVRVPAGGRPADLLLASTGLGPVTRFVLTAGRVVTSRPLTTLLPYRSPQGPLLIAARPSRPRADGVGDPLQFDLLWSLGLGRWTRFGELVVSDQVGPDPTISFDPIENPLPDLEVYSWVRRLREPAYGAARDESGRA